MPKLTDSALSVSLSLPFIEELNFATIEALKSVPKRGLEIGGILLGRHEAGQFTIVVEEYEPVDSEHLYGPSWSLSPKDQSAFREALARLRSRSSQQSRPVGFYRSQTREGFGFDDQDNAIAGEMFPGPAICLLVKPSLARPSVAQIGLKTDNVLLSVATFPFHAGVLREGDYQIVEESTSAMALPEHASASKPVPESAGDPAPALKRSKRLPLLAVLLSAAAILAGAFLVNRHQVPHETARLQRVASVAQPVPVKEQPVQQSPVILSVRRQDGAAILSWNHEASAVEDADYALLIIEDGRNREQLRLNKTELATGRVIYIPRGRDVSFQLQLYAHAHSTTESIRSFANLPEAPTTRVAGNVATGDAQEPAPPPTVQSFSENAAPVTPPPPAPPVQQPTQSNTPPPANENKPAPFPESPAPAQADKTPPKPRDPAVVTTASLELIGPSGFKEVLGDLSPRRLLRFHSGNDKLTPPRVLRQTLPTINGALASRIRGARQVDVKITVGASGQVVKTELMDDGSADPINSTVFYAARQWTFEPARNGDRPVESKVLMHFVLKRSS